MTATLERPITEPSPPPKRRRLRIAIAMVLAVVVGVIGFRAYNAFVLYNSGERVDIGGRSLFIDCAGTGSPTVILEHGLGMHGFDWKPVQDAIDDTTRVCYTSRAGMGFSDPAPGEGMRTMQNAVDDLTAALAAAEVRGPYVLVGHSAGGFSIRLFADQHPDDVAGMVLVDTTHEDLTTRLRAAISSEAWAEIAGFYGGEGAENMDLEASSAEVAAIGDLGDIPLVVLEAGRPENDDPPPGVSQSTIDEVQAAFLTIEPGLQTDLAQLSTNSTQVLVEDAGHFIHMERPDIVIDAIESVLGN